MHIVLTQVGYLDAGTGSIIIQAIVGVAAGIGLFARRKLAGLARLFSKKSKSGKADSVANAANKEE